MVHLLFNIIGATLFIIIVLALPLASWIEMLAGANLRLQIAFAHIIFNVVTTLLLLPLSGLLEKLAYLVVRGEDKQEEPMRLEYFDTRLFSTPPVAVQQLFREVQRMADIVTANYRFAMQYYFAPKDLSVDEFDNNEQVIDYLNAEITQNLIELKGLNLRSEDIRLVGSLFHVVNDLERIGDHSMNIVEIGSARKKEKLRFSGKAEREIEELSGIVTSMLDKSIHIVRQQITDVEIIGEVIEPGKPGGPSCAKHWRITMSSASKIKSARRETACFIWICSTTWNASRTMRTIWPRRWNRTTTINRLLW